ncbi:MAG: nucleotide exchange factor GrpE [Bacteroidales bacterium]|nr:nucleotide exchange factor GrpE [Bacteroidales bacterium]
MEEKKEIEIQEDEIQKQTNQEVENPSEEPKEKVTEKQDAPNEEKMSAEEPSKRRHKGRRDQAKALEEAKAKYAELNDTYLRLYSEFDNYRKRTAKEKLDMTATASAAVIKDMLPVMDDFERALQNMEKNGNEADLQGVTLIYNKLKTTLQKRGLEEIIAIDCDFNTDEHEALTMIPAPDESKKGKVIDVIQKGYKLNGTVIRFARVVVGN